MKEIFDCSGKWYKGNLHMHTTKSDGLLEPEAAIDMYIRAGYDFLAVTDHWKQCEEHMDKNILVMSGIELDTGDMIDYPIYHIVGAGMEKEIGLEPDRTRNPQELIDAVHRAGGIAILAHPAWSVTNPAAAMELKGLEGAEIFNTISDIPFGNGARADSSLYFDLWATQGKRFCAMAADDSHYYRGEQTRSYIMVNAPELSHASIIDSIRSGNFYASQGPEFIQIRRKDDVIEVECAKAAKAVFYSNCVWSQDRVKDASDGNAAYRLNMFDRYIRVELIDEDGNHAWSSPFSIM